MDINFRVLKEPLGFIRIIQIVMAIFAFATTSGFGSKSSFRVKCITTDKETDINYEYGYPFRLRYASFIVPKCDGTYDTTTEKIPFDFSSSAEFYVATGVLTFMYSLGVALFYIFAHQKYIDDQVVPVTIFGFANCLLWAASLWFVYKETVFHYQRQELVKQLPPQYPQIYPQTQFPGMDMQFQ
ncbi:synaptophysin-like [Tachypleus tridentatus]|uniref:synaptophysin-like n=1 Tax=Tachypleus tridentatus TaxID=6853 RepID=UPI003FCF8E86